MASSTFDPKTFFDKYNQSTSNGGKPTLNDFISMFGGKSNPNSEKSPFTNESKPLSIDVNVTLSQLYNGTIKKMKVGQKIFLIDIKKGYKTGTKITYPKEFIDNILYDIVFTIRQVTDKTFVIEKDNLVCKFNQNNFLSLKKYKMKINHPDGTILEYVVTSEILQNGDIIVLGRGMWNNKNKQYGDLIIRCE